MSHPLRHKPKNSQRSAVSEGEAPESASVCPASATSFRTGGLSARNRHPIGLRLHLLWAVSSRQLQCSRTPQPENARIRVATLKPEQTCFTIETLPRRFDAIQDGPMDFHHGPFSFHISDNRFASTSAAASFCTGTIR